MKISDLWQKYSKSSDTIAVVTDNISVKGKGKIRNIVKTENGFTIEYDTSNIAKFYGRLTV